MNPIVFDEDKLQQEIHRIWGDYGAHAEVFSGMRAEITSLRAEAEALRKHKATLLAAASQARFALRELTPLDPDAGFTIRMLDAAIAATKEQQA